MEGWHDYFVAQAGASAALAGLIFVAISISLNDLIGYPHLLLQAGASLTLLMTVLITSGLVLAPDQPEWVVGAEILAVGTLAWLIATTFGLRAVRKADPPHRSNTRTSVGLYQLATVPIVVAGLWVFVAGREGLHWLLPGFAAAFVVAVLEAWVLLVEVHR